MTLDPITQLQNSTYRPTTEPATQSFDTVDFMKLMIAQMRNQNPLDESQNPADFMGQLAQFEMVSKLSTIADGIHVMQGLQELSSAASMIGKTVVGTQVDALPAVLDEVSREMYGAPFGAITLDQQRAVAADPRSQEAAIGQGIGLEYRGVVDKVVVGADGIPLLYVDGKVLDLFSVSVVE